MIQLKVVLQNILIVIPVPVRLVTLITLCLNEK
jgi:hypothetical protein